MSSQWKTTYENGFTAITLEGGSAAVKQAVAAFGSCDITVASASNNSLILSDVFESKLPLVEEIAVQHKLTVTGMHEPKDYMLRTEMNVRRAIRLSLVPGSWYFAEAIEDAFPFVMVRDVRMEKLGSGDDDVQLIDLELYDSDGSTPNKETVLSTIAASYGLRPATEDDFAKYDLVPPATGFVETSFE